MAHNETNACAQPGQSLEPSVGCRRLWNSDSRISGCMNNLSRHVHLRHHLHHTQQIGASSSKTSSKEIIGPGGGMLVVGTAPTGNIQVDGACIQSHYTLYCFLCVRQVHAKAAAFFVPSGNALTKLINGKALTGIMHDVWV